MKSLYQDTKMPTKRWGQLSQWLEPNDVYLQKWKDWMEKDGFPCEIRCQGNLVALFVFQVWYGLGERE